MADDGAGDFGVSPARGLAHVQDYRPCANRFPHRPIESRYRCVVTERIERRDQGNFGILAYHAEIDGSLLAQSLGPVTRRIEPDRVFPSGRTDKAQAARSRSLAVDCECEAIVALGSSGFGKNVSKRQERGFLGRNSIDFQQDITRSHSCLEGRRTAADICNNCPPVRESRVEIGSSHDNGIIVFRERTHEQVGVHEGQRGAVRYPSECGAIPGVLRQSAREC